MCGLLVASATLPAVAKALLVALAGAGSYVLGLVLVLAERRAWPEAATVAIGVGFLGAFTTFSTVSYETWTLARTERATAAALHAGLSLAGGLLAAAGGYLTRPGRRLRTGRTSRRPTS